MDETVTPSSSRRRVVAVVALWAIVMTVTGFATGCYGRNCEGEVEFYGRKQSEGQLLSADKWASGPIDGRWLDFPKQRAWIFELNALGTDRAPVQITPYVSAQADPLHEEGGSFSIAGGNLAEISAAQKGLVVVKNGTCADYFLYVVVESAPRPPNSSPFPGSGGPEAGAEPGDAEAGP